MASIPHDMLFSYRTPAGMQYWSVWVQILKNKISVVKIDEEDFFSLIMEANLKKSLISPPDFPYELPPDIIGDVSVYLI